MGYDMATAYNANTEHWCERMKGMRVVYGIETNVSGGLGTTETVTAPEIEIEPGNKERFGALLKVAAKPKKRA